MALQPIKTTPEFEAILRPSGSGTYEVTVPMKIIDMFGLRGNDKLIISILDKIEKPIKITANSSRTAKGTKLILVTTKPELKDHVYIGGVPGLIEIFNQMEKS